MSRDPEEDLLIEATLGAYRERDSDGMPQPPMEWADLSPEGRERAFDLQLESRALESARDIFFRSQTVHAVLARIR